MATEVGDLIVKIGADISQLKSSMAEVSDSLTKVQDQTNQMSSSVFNGVASWDLLKEGLMRAKSFLEDVVTESVKADSIMALTRGTIAAAGVEWGNASDKISVFSKKMENLGRDGEDASLSFAKLYRATKDWSQSEKLATLASDLMASGIGDVETNTDALARLMGGNASKMAKLLGVNIQGLADKNELLRIAEGKVTQTTEEWADTSEGRLSRVKGAWTNLKEEIGEAFMNAMDDVLKQGGTYLQSADEQIQATNFFSQVFYGLAQMFLFGVDVIQNVGLALKQLGTFFGAVGKIAVQLDTTIGNVFLSMGSIAKGFAQGLVDLAHGDFGGALDSFKNSFNDTASAISNGVSNMVTDVSGAFSDMNGTFAEMGQNSMDAVGHLVEAFQQKNFSPVEDTSKKVEHFTEDLYRAGAAAKDTTKPFKDLMDTLKNAFSDAQNTVDELLQSMGDKLDRKKTKWKEYRNSAEQELKELEKSHRSTMESIGEQIDKLKTSFSDSQEKNTQDFKKNMAEQVVSHEDKIAEIKKQLEDLTNTAKNTGSDLAAYGTIYGKFSLKNNTSGSSDEKRKELEKQLSEENSFLNASKKYLTKYNIDVDSMRKYQHMNEADRMAYDYEQQKIAAKNEYDTQIASLKQQKEDERKIYSDSYSQIEDRLETHRLKHRTKMEQIREFTKDTLGKILDSYKNTFDKIDETILNSGVSDLIDSLKKVEVGDLNTSKMGKIMGQRMTGGDIHQTGAYILHKGEKVISAANVQRSGSSKGSVSMEVNFNNPSVRSDADLQSISNTVKDTIRQVLSRDDELARYGVY